MTLVRLFLASVGLSLVTLASGCDRHRGPHFGPGDLPDLESLDDDLWARSLEIGDFLYEETTVHEWGDCTTTKTTTIAGNGGCSIGMIGVGVEQPDGTLVSGVLQPCGTLEWTESHSSDVCGTDNAGSIEVFPVQLVLSADTE
ncbi:MAG TPA: hypothetical protein VFG69_13190, partial [Nannocystaceae bacterium]|nr:hypothetical protein [Nannocystaceae bacterium]